MRTLIQRVTNASVSVDGRIVGEIGPGFLVLAGVKRGDSFQDCEWLASKIVGLRVFPDEAGKMNRSVLDAGGSVLLVSQFTLYGDVRKGRRPSFEAAARPEEAVPLLDALKQQIEKAGVRVETGEFGAMMSVSLVNDGPVTIMLDSHDRPGRSSESPTREAPLAARAPDPSSRIPMLGADRVLQGVPLVLASASPRRRDLLRGIGLSFTVEHPDLDERRDIPEAPRERAIVLAERKARLVGARFRECVVLSADTIVELDGKVYEKPGDADDARRMLRDLSGREHRVVTAVSVGHAARDVLLTRAVTTRVRFRAVEEEEIIRYVETGEPFGKAGSYALQGLGGVLVSEIEGDITNVIGLPIGATLDLLAEALGRSPVRTSDPGDGP